MIRKVLYKLLSPHDVYEMLDVLPTEIQISERCHKPCIRAGQIHYTCMYRTKGMKQSETLS